MEDVLVGTDQRASALALELGGTLDIGDVHVRLPWSEVDSVDVVGALQYLMLPVADDELDSPEADSAGDSGPAAAGGSPDRVIGKGGKGGKGDAGDPVRASLDAGALFAVDSADPKLATEQDIADLLVQLEGLPDIARIEVVGRTDSTGPDAYDPKLSRQRAEAVAELPRADLPDVPVDAKGVGEAEPQASNDTPEGRQLDRRVGVTAFRR